MPLTAEVQQAVKAVGYERPTPVQTEIIPHLLVGRDVLAQSQTGTGKTAAFALPILSRIETESPVLQVLVLVPTRELAIQVSDAFSTYGANTKGFRQAVIYGGQDYEIQYRQLRQNPQVVVGTPGRVIDHIKRGKLDISEIECLVLDEADEMLNMGFLEDVKFVLDHAPDYRQIALFSATLPEPIRKIAHRYLNNPAKVTIQRKTMTADSIRQRAVFVSPRDRIELLIRFLEAENADGVIVFTRTRESTTIVAEKLARAGVSAAALNGEMPQRSRERTIERLKSGKLDVLVATDVAARGLDVSRISHVFNYDFPEGSESYVHRVGRTGRAGKAGEAIIFLTHAQRSKLRFVEKATRQPIEFVEPPSIDQVNAARIKRFYERLDQTIAHRELRVFTKLVDDYAQQSGHSVDLIAAAIAMTSQNGRDFLMKDRPIGGDTKRSEKRSRKKNEARDQPRKGRRERSDGPPAPGMARFRIAVGKRDGVRPGNIVGAVINEARIESDEIGPIQIHQSYSTIDLPSDKGSKIMGMLKETRVSGRLMKIRSMDATERAGSSSGKWNRKPAAASRNDKRRSNKKKFNRK